MTNKLRDLVGPGSLASVMSAHNPLSARLAELAGVFVTIIRADGGIHNVDRRIASVEEIFELQRVAEMKSIEQKYLR